MPRPDSGTLSWTSAEPSAYGLELLRASSLASWEKNLRVSDSLFFLLSHNPFPFPFSLLPRPRTQEPQRNNSTTMRSGG